MFRNYLTVAVRNLVRHKVYSLINILGLAIGMACCILILLFVQDEFSYDRYHEKAEQIYRVLGPRTCFPLGAVARDALPEVIEMVRFTFKWERLVGYGEKRFKEPNFIYADPNIFEVFSFPLLKGDPQNALKGPFSVVITEKTAQKYFGHEDPMGKVISVENEHDYTVTGVLKEIPHNSHFRFDFLATFVGAEKVFWKEFLDHWGMGNFYTYLLLHENSSIPEVEAKMYKAIVKPMQERNPELTPYRPHLQPLLDIHLYSADLKGDIESQGNITHIYVFSAIAFFILLIACINFMNLSTAQSTHRAKEVGMRKVVGARRLQLIKQFLGESFFLAAIALLVALALVELLLPRFSVLAGKELLIAYGGKWSILFGFIGITLFVGLIAGSYPAFFLSAFEPVEVLKGTTKTGASSTLFRRTLVVLQFAISVALIVGTGVIYSQMDYLRNKKLGFDKEHVVVVKIPDSDKLEALKGELSKYTDMLSVSAADRVPPDRWGNNSPYRLEGTDREWWIRTIPVDYDYFKTLGIKLAEGRPFLKAFATDAEEALVLNEAAVKELGLESPIGEQVKACWFGWKGKVIGVVKDFHFESLYEKIKPIVFVLQPNACWQLVLRIRPDNIPGTLAFIERKWREFFPERVFEYGFVDENFEKTYRAEEKIGKIVSYAALLAIFIACLGLFGLTSFATEQRTKEIGIRKILGASVPNIVLLLSKEFTKLVILSNLIAWPVAYWAMNRWLQDFAYRIHIGFGTFLLAAVLALGIALLTVGFQAIKAALANPVEALRYE
jgi:putative ABC transport system permease protein